MIFSLVSLRVFARPVKTRNQLLGQIISVCHHITVKLQIDLIEMILHSF
ncbi:MAG: hypothetical protein GWN33_03590 [Gammaproteobacteria bacterium]|nr:hypothetical protein [Gammaproteobacteria bacterium]